MIKGALVHRLVRRDELAIDDMLGQAVHRVIQMRSEIDIAIEIAERAHRGQVDKFGAPYIQHREMVAALVRRLPAVGAKSERRRLAAHLGATNGASRRVEP